MKRFYKKNQPYILIFALGLAVVFFGFYLKKNREYRLNQLNRGSAPISAKSPTITDEDEVQEDSSVGFGDYFWEALTPEQQAAKERQMQTALKAVRERMREEEKEVRLSVERIKAKQFTTKEVSAIIQNLNEDKNLTGHERLGGFTMLRNDIMMSRTTLSEKQRMLAEIDEQIKKVKLPQFIRYEVEETETDYILRPVFKE